MTCEQVIPLLVTFEIKYHGCLQLKSNIKSMIKKWKHKLHFTVIFVVCCFFNCILYMLEPLRHNLRALVNILKETLYLNANYNPNFDHGASKNILDAALERERLFIVSVALWWMKLKAV